MKRDAVRRPGANLRVWFLGTLASVLLWPAFLPLQSAAAEGPRLAIFSLELLDTSLEGEVYGENQAEQARLVMVSDLLRQLLTESKRYEVLEMAPLREKIADAGYIYSCNGCDVALARELGADQALTGLVQKVSNLILNINFYLRDVETGELLKVMSADIRGNTDESWSHGVSWLVRNRLLK